jgi:hypothetical protein
MRLLGIPFGSSPISPLSCAPTGLKYLNNMMLHWGSAFCISRAISSR